jgi:methyl-accepting chemotaxis protein
MQAAMASDLPNEPKPDDASAEQWRNAHAPSTAMWLRELSYSCWIRGLLGATLAGAAGVLGAALGGSVWAGLSAVLLATTLLGVDGWAQAERRRQALTRALNAARAGTPLETTNDGLSRELVAFLEAWQELWNEVLGSREQALQLAQHVGELPGRMNQSFAAVERAASGQEAAVEETASLLAHMRSSMSAIGGQVDALLTSADRSASSVQEMGASIEEVAQNSATLHEVVEASTASVHQMGASIRQVAEGAEEVQQMAESTAISVTQMDRSIQEVSGHALEAATLTQSVYAGAESGSEAVRATIEDIEQISTLTSEAKERLGGLVARVSQIGDILAAIDEINDETNLLSLNAAIIAAQAGEQGKAFLVVANHVKTLARRTAGSTQDIERLIADIELESGSAVRAMEAGIAAVDGGVERSRAAGEALSAIREACRDATERVDEIARATAEQSSNSKGVAEATRSTSAHVQQISQAMSEQRRASEEMLMNAERALDSCRQVHRSTEEQRRASGSLTESISNIRDQIHTIGEQTTAHSRASEDVASAVVSLLENAQHAGRSLGPLRELATTLQTEAGALTETLSADAAAPADLSASVGKDDGEAQCRPSATASPAR